MIPESANINTIRHSSFHAAFTLVELLVVVAIIVLLLSMLTPAVNRAVYRARLASCAVQQRTTASGVHAYAFDNSRYYPDRQLPPPGSSTDRVPAPLLAGADTPESNHAPIDIRPLLRAYIQINKQLNDPLTDAVDLEFEGAVREVTSVCSYDMWFGWGYLNSNIPLIGMDRIGDNWEFAWNTTTDTIRTYGLLMGDQDLTWNGTDNISASHPDASGSNPRLVNQPVRDVFIFQYGARSFQSFWVWHVTRGTKAQRDPLDLNFTYNDESVHQFNGYAYMDDRYDNVPYFFDSSLASFMLWIPKR